MNDDFNMDNIDNIPFSDVSMADETNVTEKEDAARMAVSATDSLTVADTTASRLKCFISKYWFAITILIISVFFMCFGLKSNAAEKEFIVDENYITSNFPDYNYWVLVRNVNNSGYYFLFSDSPILGSINSYDYYTIGGASKVGFMYMRLDENNNVVMLTGPSPNLYSDISRNGFWFNEVFSTFNTCELIYANHDIYSMKSTSSGYSVGDYLIFERSSVNSTPTPPIDSSECKFNDENIVASIEKLDSDLVAKMDIVIMLLVVMIALKMFSPLANNHKRGLERKEK